MEAMKRLVLWAALLSCAAVRPAAADAGWFESGDMLLRNDLLLLNDAGIIRLPVNQWPMPRAAVRYALDHAKDHFATNAAVMAALARTRDRAGLLHAGFTFDGSVTAGNAPLLRDFDAFGREDGELSARAGFATPSLEVSLRVTGVADASDDRALRADGSHATWALGNWLISAQTLERWWGPAHEGSLILSSNARPMPSLLVERATAREFGSRWLSWLGPWRFSFGVGRMEGEREDIDAPLFMAWRVTVMPLHDIELGFSRTAQFCGEQLSCTLNTFGNMLAGNDNVGIDATPENEPGNQMAGFDIRWNSPLGNLPYAIYSQFIGEDESSYLPAKYLGQYGLETWKVFPDGANAQMFAEYSNTTASGMSSRGPYYNESYNQGRFNAEGYRYHGRVMGHTADSDAETYALGGTLTTAQGRLWSATLRAARLNHDGFDPRNTVSPGPSEYAALELGWRGEAFGGHVRVDLGAESLEPEGEDRTTDAYGFVSWQYEFNR
jgi:hypothetical protein